MPWYEYETFEKWYKSKLNGRDGIGVIVVARTLLNGKNSLGNVRFSNKRKNVEAVPNRSIEGTNSRIKAIEAIHTFVSPCGLVLFV